MSGLTVTSHDKSSTTVNPVAIFMCCAMFLGVMGGLALHNGTKEKNVTSSIVGITLIIIAALCCIGPFAAICCQHLARKITARRRGFRRIGGGSSTATAKLPSTTGSAFV